MRRYLTTLVPGTILAATVLAHAVAQDNRAATPDAPIDAGDRAGRAIDEPGSVSGFFVNDHTHSGSFFFAEIPGDCHYTFPFEMGGANAYYMLHEKLEFSGSDRTGQYWQYQSIRPGVKPRGWYLPKFWYVPKDVRKQPGIWYQTDEPGAKPVIFGRPIELLMLSCPKK